MAKLLQTILCHFLVEEVLKLGDGYSKHEQIQEAPLICLMVSPVYCRSPCTIQLRQTAQADKQQAEDRLATGRLVEQHFGNLRLFSSLNPTLIPTHFGISSLVKLTFLEICLRFRLLLGMHPGKILRILSWSFITKKTFPLANSEKLMNSQQLPPFLLKSSFTASAFSSSVAVGRPSPQ